MTSPLQITPELLLRGYAAGIFPMAESADATELRWYDPSVRAVIPLDSSFHVPRSLKRTILKKPYTITLNRDFDQIIRACALPQPGRESTWINQDIIDLYTTLQHYGFAHSIEVWDGDYLAGGLYGVSLGGAFFGESMVSFRRDASKIALVYLVSILRRCGFTLLDTQFQTDHLRRFGTYEIPRAHYHRLLAEAIALPVRLIEIPTTEWDQLSFGT